MTLLRMLFLVVAALATMTTGAAAQAPPAGQEGQPAFQTARAESEIRVDGVMEEAAWGRAARVPLPYEYQPGDNVPPPVQTDCFVTYDTRNLYIGCRALCDAVDFTENRPADRLMLNPTLEWKVGKPLNLQFNHTLEQLSVDAGRLYTANLSQVRAIYHFNVRTFLRAILQYTHVSRDPDLYSTPTPSRTAQLFSQTCSPTRSTRRPWCLPATPTTTPASKAWISGRPTGRCS